MHAEFATPLATSPDTCPPEPWYAARLEAAVLAHQDALSWLGDFECCIAWAWVLRKTTL